MVLGLMLVAFGAGLGVSSIPRPVAHAQEAVSDAEAVRFANEWARPMAEEARAFSIRVTAMETVWFGGVNAKFAKAADSLDDKRDADGVSRLTSGDVTTLVANLIAARNALDPAVVSKPCVRTVDVQ